MPDAHSDIEALSRDLKKALAESGRAEIIPIIHAAVRQALGESTRAARPEFLSVNDVLALLSVSRTQLYRILAEGDLRPVKRGRSTLIHRHDIDRYIARLRGEAIR
jgi:excisionase family DNA binding protein